MHLKLYTLLTILVLSASGLSAQDCRFNCTSVNVPLNETCQRLLSPESMLLNPEPLCLPRMKVIVFDQNGRNYGNLVTSQVAGYKLTYKVVDTTTGNHCWGHLTVMDNMPPTNTLPDTTINCTDPLPEIYNLRDSCGAPVRAIVLSNTTIDYPCGSTYIKQITRRVRLSDPWNNSRDVTQIIYVRPVALVAIICPDDEILNCDVKINGRLALTDPTYATRDNDGYYHPLPVVNASGQSIGLVDPPSYLNSMSQRIYLNAQSIQHCKWAMSYDDMVFPTCQGVYKIRRTWYIRDWCNRTEATCTQWISIKEVGYPALPVLPDITLSVGSHACGAIYNLKAPALTSSCTVVKAHDVWFHIDEAGDYGSGKVIVQGSLPPNGTKSIELPAGHFIAFFEVKDQCGRIYKTKQHITVIDNIAPSMSCKNYSTVVLKQGDCTAEIAAKDLGIKASDNCCNLFHYAVAHADTVDYYRQYWQKYFTSCLGSSKYNQKKSEINAVIEEWISLFVFTSTVALPSCEDTKVEVRAFSACGLKPYDHYYFHGTEHEWYAYQTRKDYVCSYIQAFPWAKQGEIWRPGISCNKNGSPVAAIDYCKGFNYANINSLTQKGVSATEIGHLKNLYNQRPAVNGEFFYTTCRTTVEITDTHAPKITCEANKEHFMDGVPAEGNLEISQGKINFQNPVRSANLNCPNTGAQTWAGGAYGHYRYLNDLCSSLSSYSPLQSQAVKPVYCQGWLLLDYYDQNGAVTPASLFKSPTVTDGCSGTKLTSNLQKTTTTALSETWVNKYTATDGCKNTSTCSVTLTLNGRSDFEVLFPGDTTLQTSDLSKLPKPTITDQTFEKTEITFEDFTDTVGIIWRLWRVQDKRFTATTAADIIVDDRVVAGPNRSCVPRWLKDNGDGLVIYLQKITLADQVDPVVVCSRDTVICGNFAPCDSFAVNLSLGTFTDNSTPAAQLIILYQVMDQNKQVAAGSGPVLKNKLATGSYTIKVQASDLAGNLVTCDFTLGLESCFSPALLCNDTTLVILDSSAQKVILASQFLNTTSCGLTDTVWHATFSHGTSLTLGCDQAVDSIIGVPIYLWEGNNKVDSCHAYFLVSDIFGHCTDTGGIDDPDPVFACTPDTIVCLDPVMCLALVHFNAQTLFATDQLNVQIRLRVKTKGQSNFLIDGMISTLDILLPGGSYDVQWLALGNQGPMDSCAYTMEVADCHSAVTCVDTLVVTLDSSTATAFVKASDMVADEQGCSTASERDFYIGDIGVKGLVLDCEIADGQPRNYRLIAKAKDGHLDTCIVPVIVTDKYQICGSGLTTPDTGSLITGQKHQRSLASENESSALDLREQESEFTFSARPNPFNQTLTLNVSGPSGVTDILAYTAQGQNFWTKRLEGSATTADVQTYDWPSGLIILQVKQGDKVSYHKLIKQ